MQHRYHTPMCWGLWYIHSAGGHGLRRVQVSLVVYTHILWLNQWVRHAWSHQLLINRLYTSCKKCLWHAMWHEYKLNCDVMVSFEGLLLTLSLLTYTYFDDLLTLSVLTYAYFDDLLTISVLTYTYFDDLLTLTLMTYTYFVDLHLFWWLAHTYFDDLHILCWLTLILMTYTYFRWLTHTLMTYFDLLTHTFITSTYFDDLHLLLMTCSHVLWCLANKTSQMPSKLSIHSIVCMNQWHITFGEHCSPVMRRTKSKCSVTCGLLYEAVMYVWQVPRPGHPHILPQPCLVLPPEPLQLQPRLSPAHHRWLHRVLQCALLLHGKGLLTTDSLRYLSKQRYKLTCS